MSFSLTCKTGIKVKRKEKCASSSKEDHLSGRGVGFDHNETSQCHFWFSRTHPDPLDAILQTWPRLRPYAVSFVVLEARRSVVPLQTFRCICLSCARRHFTLDRHLSVWWCGYCHSQRVHRRRSISEGERPRLRM